MSTCSKFLPALALVAALAPLAANARSNPADPGHAQQQLLLGADSSGQSATAPAAPPRAASPATSFLS